MRLAGEALPPFPDDEQEAIYTLLATVEAEGAATARLAGVTVDAEREAA